MFFSCFTAFCLSVGLLHFKQYRPLPLPSSILQHSTTLSWSTFVSLFAQYLRRVSPCQSGLPHSWRINRLFPLPLSSRLYPYGCARLVGSNTHEVTFAVFLSPSLHPLPLSPHDVSVFWHCLLTLLTYVRGCARPHLLFVPRRYCTEPRRLA